MSPVLASGGAVLLVGVTVGAVTGWGQLRYARRLPSFRCRLGPPTARWRRRRSRWRLRGTRAAWVGDVLVLRTGLLRLWLTPIPVALARDVRVQDVPPGQLRGLGPHPVALRFTRQDGDELRVAVAQRDSARLVGPYLIAALSGLPDAPRERGT